MAIEAAPMGGANRRPAARYQALSSGRPQDPTLQEQAAAMAKQKAMSKGEELATPYLDDLFTSLTLLAHLQLLKLLHLQRVQQWLR